MAVTTKGYITVEIGAEGDMRKFTLDGTVGARIEVGFRAKDGAAELALGSFTNIIGSVVAALGADEQFKPTLDKRLVELEEITPLKPIVVQLREAPIFVTDLFIAAVYEEDGEGGGKYKVTDAAFGFRVEFSGLKLGPIALAGFGVLFEYTNGAPEQPSNGKLQTRALPA